MPFAALTLGLGRKPAARMPCRPGSHRFPPGGPACTQALVGAGEADRASGYKGGGAAGACNIPAQK
jgi:hypothetical protein